MSFELLKILQYFYRRFSDLFLFYVYIRTYIIYISEKSGASAAGAAGFGRSARLIGENQTAPKSENSTAQKGWFYTL